MELDAHGVRAGLIGIAGVTLAMLALAGCSSGDGSGDGSPTGASSTASGHSTDGMGDDGVDPDDGSEAHEVGFDELLADPTAFVGRRIRVTGNVFFVSECPPPGASVADCVLLGYLVGPEQHTLIAADVPQAIALAEGGRRLSCIEGSQATPTCGDWSAEATYTIDGVLEHQVLGGRESQLVQLDVAEKGAAQPR